jgi:hypothetical protein
VNFPEVITQHNALQHDLLKMAKHFDIELLMDVHQKISNTREIIAEKFAERSFIRLTANDNEELRNQIIDGFILQGCFYDIFEKHFKNDPDMIQRLQSAYNTMVNCLQKYRNVD